MPFIVCISNILSSLIISVSPTSLCLQTQPVWRPVKDIDNFILLILPKFSRFICRGVLSSLSHSLAILNVSLVLRSSSLCFWLDSSFSREMKCLRLSLVGHVIRFRPIDFIFGTSGRQPSYFEVSRSVFRAAITHFNANLLKISQIWKLFKPLCLMCIIYANVCQDGNAQRHQSKPNKQQK